MASKIIDPAGPGGSGAPAEGGVPTSAPSGEPRPAELDAEGRDAGRAGGPEADGAGHPDAREADGAGHPDAPEADGAEHPAAREADGAGHPVGHTWPMGLVEGSRTVKAGYLWISSFHMPAFILLSGWCAPPVLVAGGVAAYAVAPGTDVHWLWMSYGQAELGVGTLPYLLVRLALFAVTALMNCGFLALVPRRTRWLTGLGAVTLYPYLLHGLLTSAAHAYGWDAPLRPLGPLGVALLTACGAAVAVLLSTVPVRRLARPLIEPPVPGLNRPRRRESPPGTSEPRTA